MAAQLLGADRDWPFVAYEPAVGCSAGPQPGVVAASQAILQALADFDVYSLGIFNCRRVAGGLTWSLHAEGRAFDLGWSDGTTSAEKEEALARFMPAAGLGIQRLISERRLYDRQTPGGRDYTGEDPHVGHAHIEWGWAAARSLTLTRAQELIDIPGGSDVEEIRQALAVILQRMGSVDAPDTILGDLRYLKDAIVDVRKHMDLP